MACACQSDQPTANGVIKSAQTTEEDLYGLHIGEGIDLIAPTGYEDYWVICDSSESTELVCVEYYGIYDRAAEEYVVDCIWSEEPVFSDGLARIRQDGYYGYIDGKGEMVIAPQFTECCDFQSGRAAVCMNKWGVIDTDGSFILAPQWEDVEILEPVEELTDYYSWQPVGKGMIWVSDGEYSGLFDFDGIEVIEVKYKNIDYGFTETGIYAPSPNGWYILFDYDGNNQMNVFGESSKARQVTLPKHGVHIVSKFLQDNSGNDIKEETIYRLYDENYEKIPEVVSGWYTYVSAFSDYNRAVVILASSFKGHLWSYEAIEDGFFLIDNRGNSIAELPQIPGWKWYSYSANEYYVVADNKGSGEDYLIDLQTMEYTPWKMARMFGSAVVTIDEDTGLYFLFDNGTEIASNCTDITYGCQISDEGNEIMYGFSCYHGNICTDYTTDWQPYSC